jgi:hypothetical protein
VRRAGLIVFAFALAAGCGDRLVGGGYYGDATLRLHGVISSALGDPSHAQVGAAWLGYSGLVDPTAGIDTTVLPITSIQSPTNFECDVLDAPPSAGRYAAYGGGIIPASIRLARLMLFDDVDNDGRFALDAALHIVSPDQLLAVSDGYALLFVEQPPVDPSALDGADTLLTNWEAVDANYNVVALDPAIPGPDLSGKVVDNETRIRFNAPTTGAAF